MYNKINSKIKLHKVFIGLIKFLFFCLFIFLIFLFIRDLISIQKIKITNINSDISLNVIKNPIIQNNTNNDMLYITSDKGIIGKNNTITLYNTKVSSENIYGEAKEVFVDNDKNIIILKKKPFIIFDQTN